MDVLQSLATSSSSSNPSPAPPSLHPARSTSIPNKNLLNPSQELISSKHTGPGAGCPLPPFSPYEAKVPWHTGIRAFLSLFFPKYGNYCGPNWSSGRSSGSLVWDKRPVDWLDHCCFCHDIGYDSHDQARLYKADLAFLDCLNKMPPLRNNLLASLHRNAYITGLRTLLIPYRRMLLAAKEKESLHTR